MNRKNARTAIISTYTCSKFTCSRRSRGMDAEILDSVGTPSIGNLFPAQRRSVRYVAKPCAHGSGRPSMAGMSAPYAMGARMERGALEDLGGDVVDALARMIYRVCMSIVRLK